MWLALCFSWAVWVLRPARPVGVLPPWRRRAVPWTGWEVVAALLLMWLCPSFLAAGLHAAGFFGRVYGAEFQAHFDEGKLDALDSIRLTLWMSDLALPLVLASTLVLFYLSSGTRPYQLGLTASRLGKYLLLGVVTSVCVVPVVYLILVVANWLLRFGTGGVPEEHPIQRLIESHPPPIDFVVGGLAALVAAPLLEEFVFRGIIQPWFRVRSWGGYGGVAGALALAVARRWNEIQSHWASGGWPGVWPQLLPAAFVLVMVPGYLLVRAKLPPAAGAVYATSLLFAAAHSSVWPSPIPLFFFALALGTLRYRTQSLVPSVVVHGLFNGVAWMLLLIQPADKPEKGNETTDARARVELTSTSSAVPGSVLPRRRYASATTAPSAGE
jgi:membrane protease YdiL (CAAX protease family)